MNQPILGASFHRLMPLVKESYVANLRASFHRLMPLVKESYVATVNVSIDK
jgi:hypothetical protein